MPKLSHLRESGAIEQDADVVMMLSRPPAHESESMPDSIKLELAKQRNGPTGRVNLLFDKRMQRFKNLMEGGMAAEEPPEASTAYNNVPVEEDYEEEDVPF